MIKLDAFTDSIFPPGINGTPFHDVFSALQKVSVEVFAVNVLTWRAAVSWGWRLVNDSEVLPQISQARAFLSAVLVSENAPLVKESQTAHDLALLLGMWRSYKPTFTELEALYTAYASSVDVRPITDAESRAIMPPINERNAFYIVVKDIDWSRPLLLSEAVTIAERSTPLGSRPYAYYEFQSNLPIDASTVYGDTCNMLESETPAKPFSGRVMGGLLSLEEGERGKKEAGEFFSPKSIDVGLISSEWDGGVFSLN